MKKELMNKKGITLIALVVTIIVLLILAGVAINLSIGRNGIFKKAKLAQEVNAGAEEMEKITMAAGAAIINGIGEIDEQVLKEELKNNNLELTGENFEGNGPWYFTGTTKKIYKIEKSGDVKIVQECVSENEGEITKSDNPTNIAAENLLNLNNVKNGYAMTDSGSEFISESHLISDYIEVSEGENIYVDTYLPDYYTFVGSAESYARYVTAYDNEKNVLVNKGSSKAVNKYEVPTGVKYIKMSLRREKGNEENIVVSKSPITEYCLYGEKEARKEVFTYLAKSYDIVVGKNISIYNVNICPASLKYNVTFKWYCDIGVKNETGISFSPGQNDIGKHIATVKVYLDSKLIDVVSTEINVIEDGINEAMKLMCLGDSLTSGKPWIHFLEKYSNKMISSVGTRKDKTVVDNITYDIIHEGRSGWSPEYYLKKAEDNSITNAFYNPDISTFDYSYYKNENEIEPNGIIIFLGRNGLIPRTNKNAEYISQIVSKIRESDSNIPIYVINTIRDNADYNTSIRILTLMRELTDMINVQDNCKLIPLESSYDAKSYTINPKDKVHPSEIDGYKQFSNVIYSAIVASSKK